MRRVLHIVTKTHQPLAEEIITLQRQQQDCQVEVADLTRDEPDYALVLDKIFAADAVAVW